MAARLTLEQFSALNDELAALARSGVPWELGLKELGRDLPGRLGTQLQAIGERLATGESLLDVLADERLGVPAGYRALLEAGLRSGNPGRALEDVAQTARSAHELRWSLYHVLAYPLLVAGVAYGVFLFLLVYVTPSILDAFPSLAGTSASQWDWLRALGRSAPRWAPWPPVVALGLLILGGRWLISASWSNTTGKAASGTGWPWPTRVVAWGRLATFLDLLGALVAHSVPLPEALELAADAGGVRSWSAGARQLAARLRAGEPWTHQAVVQAGLPPSIGWLFVPAADSAITGAALQNMAVHLRRRAQAEAETLARFLPACLSLVLGIGLVLPFSLVLFLPWCHLLRDIITQAN
ncbi:MAG: type II secretion system F family protein [Pirellulales bacterium]